MRSADGCGPEAEPEGPEDERFVYVVTAAGADALRSSAAAFGGEQEADERETVAG